MLRLFITTACDWTPDNEEALDSLLDDRAVFVSGTPYTLNGRKHLITARIDRVDGDPPQAEIRLSYDATDYPDRVSIPREDRREQEFLHAVFKLTGIEFFMCNAEFLFEEVEDSAMWFPLPSQIGGTTDSPETFQIVGVDAFKIPEESSHDQGYFFTLKRSPKSEVFLDLYFPLTQEISLNLPKHALAEGRKIASRLVSTPTARMRSTE